MNYIEFYRGLNIAIIPVKANSKQTWVNWKQYQEIPPTPEDYQQWFPESYQGNYAAICGKASDNLFVLDCDTPGIEQTLFPDWENLLKSTLVIETSPKKYHVYFRGPYSFDRIQYNDGAGKEILSIRSQGAYVVVPPSIHPDTGTPYKIVSSSQYIQEIADLQGFFEGIKWILKPKKKSKPLAKKTFTEGNRNNALFREACLFHQRNLAFEAAKAALSEINQLQCEPPLGENEIESILKSAYKYDLSEERTELLSAILQAKETQEKYNLVANYLIAHNHIKSDNYRKDYYIYDNLSGLYLPDADVRLRKQIDEINSTFSAQAKNEILDKIFIRTGGDFTIYDLNSQNVIACENGVIDLDTLEVKPFSPKFLITRKIPVIYDPTVTDDTLEKFLNDICYKGESSEDKDRQEDMKTSLLEIIADCLTPHYITEVIHFLIGKGLNGKGTYLRLVEAFLGKNNRSTLGIRQLGDRFMTYQLFGKLANIDGDMSTKKLSYTGVLKKMCGGDGLTADRKNQRAIEFINTAKGIFAGQEIPMTEDETDGYIRRILVYHFSNRFTVSNFKDTFITPRLLSATLNLVLKAYTRLQQNNWHFTWQKYTPTIEHQRIALDFASNSAKAFWVYLCEFERGHETPKAEAYERYMKFCEEYDLNIKNNSIFARDLNNASGKSLKTTHPRIEGKQVTCWMNLRVRDLMEVMEVIDANPSIYGKNKSRVYRRVYFNQVNQVNQNSLTRIEEIKSRIFEMLEESEEGWINYNPTVEVLFTEFNNLDLVQKAINEMLNRGELFEPMQGRLSKP